MNKFIPGKVSLISPVYNGEKHLHRLLDSILSQSYPAMEIILADDGSTDRTLETAESYRERIEAKGYSYTILRGEHKCAAAAINLALPHVTGEFLIWPDSDDELSPDSVLIRAEFLDRHPEYACVRSTAVYQELSSGQPAAREEKEGDLTKESLFFDILESATYVCCGCYMLRTAEFFKLYPEKRIPEYDVGQNFQMLLPFMHRHRCPTIRQALYRVNVHPDSHSHRALTRAQEEKKYADYESLLDDVIRIAGITDSDELTRISRWKLERRYRLAVKYDDGRAARDALRGLRKLRAIPFFPFVKRFARSFAGKRTRAVVRRILHPFREK